jgi:hypothetical protein
MTTIDVVQDELLLEIFEYFPAENLSMTVSLVRARSRALLQKILLWKHKNLTPPVSMSDAQVASASPEVLPASARRQYRYTVSTLVH